MIQSGPGFPMTGVKTSSGRADHITASATIACADWSPFKGILRTNIFMLVAMLLEPLHSRFDRSGMFMDLAGKSNLTLS